MPSEDGAWVDRWKPGARVRAAINALLDVAWPPAMLDGEGPAAAGGFSAEGWSGVTFLEAPWCNACGAAFEHDRGAGTRCTPCEASPRAFNRLRAACLYDERSRELVLQFKHGDRLEHARLFSAWLGRAGRELLEDAEAVVPVPLHPLRLLKRRYNQAAELARPLARRHGLPYLPDALVRTRRGGQAGRSAAGRKREAAGAFLVPTGKRPLVESRRVLLIDDVLTTGATAEACARALKRADARTVDVLVVARVPHPRDLTI